MKPRLFSRSIRTFSEYRQGLHRLAELLAEDPTLDTPEAEDLLDEIARYMVDGGHLEPSPANDFLRPLGDD